MRIDVATLFPEMFESLKCGVIGKAMERGLISVNAVNIREYTADKHGKCDDTPFGGGAGMVMTPQPIHDTIRALDPDRSALRIRRGMLSRGTKPSRISRAPQRGCRYGWNSMVSVRPAAASASSADTSPKSMFSIRITFPRRVMSVARRIFTS